MEEWKRKNRYDKVISGIYILFTNDKVLYIGQSNNIHRRIKLHSQIPWTYYIYTEIDSQEKKASMEEELIKKHNPVYNILARKALLPNQINTHQHSLFIGINKERRWKAEAKIIKKYRNQVGSFSCRQMQKLLWDEFQISVNHNTINQDLKNKKYTPYL